MSYRIIRTFVENDLIRLIRLLQEAGINGEEYHNRIDTAIPFMCEERKIKEKNIVDLIVETYKQFFYMKKIYYIKNDEDKRNFTNLFMEKVKIVAKQKGFSMDDEDDRKRIKKHNWKKFQLCFFIILYKLIHRYLHLQFALMFLEV